MTAANRMKTGLGVAVLGLLLAPLAWGQDEEEMARRLIELRSEVESLNEELDLLRQEHRTEINALAAQKAELDASRSRLQTQLAQSDRQLEASRQESAAAGADDQQLIPVLQQAIDELRALIQGGIPFKQEERLAALDEIRVQMDNAGLPVSRAANRLWSFYEDEIRLTRENSVHSQTIALDGEHILADVARLGAMMMYFRTADGRYGEVVFRQDSWVFERLTDAAAIAAVETLFESLQKQIRQGYFQLPNPIAGRHPS